MEFDKDKIKTKIAISKIKEENDIVMGNKVKSAFKTTATALAGIVLSTGVVFAGTKVYENIEKTWKEPKEYVSYEEYKEDTELMWLNERIKSNVEIEKAEKNGEIISEEKAIEIANNIVTKLDENLEFTKENIKYDDIDSKHSLDLYYVIKSNNDAGKGIEIKLSANGRLYSFVDYDIAFDYNINSDNIEKNEISLKAREILNNLDIEDKYIEIKSEIIENYSEGKNKQELWAHYIKDYGGITNSYDNVDLYFYVSDGNVIVGKILTKVPELDIENNEIIIEENEAIDIAKEKDRNISELDIKHIVASLEYRPLNSFYYVQEKSNGTDDGLTMEKQEDGENIVYNRFDIENNVLRKVYNVKITYDFKFLEDEPVHDWKEQFGREYFVDATTGEIIGGRWGDNLD